MSLKRAELIIADARIASGAEDYSDTHGISQAYLLLQFQKSIARLQSALVATQAQPNADLLVYPAPSTNYIGIPEDCFSSNLIYAAAFSNNGIDYHDLSWEANCSNVSGGEPESYEIIGRKIFFDSTITTGFVRVRYERQFRGVDLRRAGLGGYSPATVGEYLTYVQAWVNSVHGADSIYPDADSVEFLKPPDYICIVDREGNFLVKNIRITGYNDGSGEFDLVGSTGEILSLPDVANRNAFIVAGKNTSSHPEGDDSFYNYFIEFLRWEIEKKRSKLDIRTDSDSLLAALGAIIETYDGFPYARSLI